MTYLICQGQKEVIEADGGCGERVILGIIARSQLQKLRKSMLTLAAVLGILEFNGWEDPLMNGIKGRD